MGVVAVWRVIVEHPGLAVKELRSLLEELELSRLVQVQRDPDQPDRFMLLGRRTDLDEETAQQVAEQVGLEIPYAEVDVEEISEEEPEEAEEEAEEAEDDSLEALAEEEAEDDEEWEE